MLAPLSSIALERAAAQAGERVIDIGCGCGATTLALADSGASVWGVDISAPMLARARERAAGRDNVAFSEADAASQGYTPDHQLIFSRFGVESSFVDASDPLNVEAAIRTTTKLELVETPGNPTLKLVDRDCGPRVTALSAGTGRTAGPTRTGAVRFCR